MRFARALFFLGCIVLPLSAVVSAQSKLKYFSAQVPVKSQSTQERKRAAGDALLEVLLRMSGSENTLEDESLRKQASRALSYVEQFQYEPITESELLKEGYDQWLSLTFSQQVVVKLLSDARQPFWSTNRPSTLVWLVEDSPEDGKQLLNEQSESKILEPLRLASEQRGLPLLFPLLDLDDQLALSAEDVWNLDEEAIRRASERYDAPTIMIGRYSTTSRGELLAIWQYFHRDVTRSYDSRIPLLENGEVDESIGIEALYPLADFLASLYATQPQLEAGGRLVLQVSAINDYSDYRRSLSYLEGLAAVSKVHIAGVRQDTMLVYLESEAGVERFIKVLELDNKLRIQADDDILVPAWQRAPRGTLDNPLKFHWAS